MRSLLALLVMLPVAALADGRPLDLKVTPSRADFSARPGQTAFQRISFKNDGTRAIAIRLRSADAWYDEQGAVTLPSAGTTPRGLGRWMTPPPEGVIVQPGKTAEVDVVIRVPPEASRGAHFGALVGVARLVDQTQPGNSGAGHRIEAGSTMEIQLALMLTVDVIPSGGREDPAELALVDVEVKQPGAARPLAIRAMVENTSDLLVRPSGSLAIFDAAGRPIATTAFSQQALWPGQRRWFDTTVPVPLEPGDYRAIAAFDEPRSRATFEEVGFTIQPATAAPPSRRRTPLHDEIR